MLQVNSKTSLLNPPEPCFNPYLTVKRSTDIACIRFPGYDDLVLNFSYQP